MSWRLAVSPLVALAVTMAIFLFIRYLISAEPLDLEKLQISGVVELYRPPPPREEPETEPEQPPETLQEPTMEALSVTASAPAPTAMPSAPALEPGDLALDIGPVGQGIECVVDLAPA